MKSTDKFVLVLVASLALLLAGCGGGGSSNTGDDMDMDMSGPQKTALMNAHTALQGAVNALVGEATQDEVNTAKTAATALQNAINAATDVAASDLTMYRNALTNANNAIGVAQGLLTKAKTMEMMAMAKKLFNGLKQGAAPDTNPTAAQTANGALENGRFVSLSSTAVTVDTDDGSDSVEPVSVKKSGSAVSSLGGWSGTDYVRKKSGTTDHVVLYNNKGAESAKFSKKHNLLLSRVPNTAQLQINQAGLTANTNYVRGDDFATAGTKPHTEDDGDEVSLDGTFDGVSGKYSCEQDDTDACTSSIDGSGDITLANGWNFIPTNLNALTQTPDTAYLVYGWWSRETSDGVDVATFTSNTPTTGNSVESGDSVANAIDGSATYKGGAAGKYAIYNPLGDNSNAGAFTASATLNADFSDDKISGQLTDFMANGESMDWSVSLNVGETDNITDSGITAGTTTWTVGDTADDPQGIWSGNFYKSNGAASNEEDAQAPAAVTGVFTAMYDVGGLNIGQMAGAFGAELED